MIYCVYKDSYKPRLVWQNSIADCTNTRPKFDRLYLLDVQFLPHSPNFLWQYANTVNAFYFFSKTVIWSKNADKTSADGEVKYIGDNMNFIICSNPRQ